MAENEKPKKLGFFAEFKKFALRGNAIEMAIGIVIGSSFNAIVNSIVQGVLNPLVGHLLGNMDLSDLRIILSPAVGEVAEVSIKYGIVIQRIIEFTITALVMFLIVRLMNRINDIQKEAERLYEEEKLKEEARIAEEQKKLKADLEKEIEDAKMKNSDEEVELLRGILALLTEKKEE